MGCDIHLITQVREDGNWVEAAPVWNTRYYDAFAWLADIRNDKEKPITPIAEMRGLPLDLEGVIEIRNNDWGNPTTAYLYGKWLGDFGHSWLTLDEILAAWQGDIQERLEAFEPFITELKLLADSNGGPQNVRIVFGFDV